MSKQELLDKILTYHQFVDLMTDAWLEAENATNIYPGSKFEHELFVKLEKFVEEFEP